jgi:hypothetical protein
MTLEDQAKNYTPELDAQIVDLERDREEWRARAEDLVRERDHWYERAGQLTLELTAERARVSRILIAISQAIEAVNVRAVKVACMTVSKAAFDAAVLPVEPVETTTEEPQRLEGMERED